MNSALKNINFTSLWLQYKQEKIFASCLCKREIICDHFFVRDTICYELVWGVIREVVKFSLELPIISVIGV